MEFLNSKERILNGILLQMLLNFFCLSYVQTDSPKQQSENCRICCRMLQIYKVCEKLEPHVSAN